MEKNGVITVELCMGSACFARGNNKTVAVLRKLVAESGLHDTVRIRGVMCTGMCKDGPVVTINGTPYHDLTGDDLAALLLKMTEEN
jgi:NADH:ubiquinone oxidoreductase subunit E